MPKSGLKELEKYKEYVKKGLAKLTPLLQKAAVGDFTEKIEIPEKEDEFSELLVGLSLMIDDLRELEKVRERSGKEKKERLVQLERWRELTMGREIKMVELKREINTLKKEVKRLKERLAQAVK